ncbi:MAG: reductive dehalogenase domain-containing protein [Alphaproteobacteria bacterium]|jgi:reductive dehalogenase|nr:reductive dehalogenase [Rhodospirillaceae bacterium]MDP6407549.1 reductive dehalogenase domain-containing protein [Alphaproteobacteria bacterium]MDP6623525.1 reductive dehalogenase domain-containing protein [Alphaproteobacteria bacterium]|tara:strand:+ start:4334 stop:5566 length:1233 start_codon:yes stop_codon:yes gene_type:complete
MNDSQKPRNLTVDGWPANRPTSSVSESDRAAGIEVTGNFSRFSQRNDMFNRSRWDDVVDGSKAKSFFRSHTRPKPRRGDGFQQRDFALRNASWVVADTYANRGMKEGRREGFLDPLEPFFPVAEMRPEAVAPEVMSRQIKRIAKLFGADLVGICEYDERWSYADRFDFQNKGTRPNELPPGLVHCIVLGYQMDKTLVDAYPSALASTAAGKEYSHEAGSLMQISQYIRNLGFEALANMNDTALAIPYAVKAGLGEYGRNQMAITEEFGPRVRFSKIFTDLPLAHDAPKRFGVTEFCEICRRCAESCPPQAIPTGPPSEHGPNRSAISGVVKWTADCEKCFDYWVKLSSDCGICMRVCPYNKDFSRPIFRLYRRLMGTRLRGLMLRLDKALGFGARRKPKDWWDDAEAAGE